MITRPFRICTFTLCTQFQAQYDLVDHTATAGPSRRTRRAHTERLQDLKVPGPPDSPVPMAKRARRSTDNAGPSASFWDIKAEAKSKGKQTSTATNDVPSPHTSHLRKGKHKQIVIESPATSPASKGKSVQQAVASDGLSITRDVSYQAGGLPQPPPRKKRRITQDIPLPRHALRSATSMPDLTLQPALTSALSSRPSNGAATRSGDVEPNLSPVKHPIPRVKLIVRRPPTILTNPEQKPKPPLHGGSVDALLSSFTYRYDREVDPEELAADLAEELGLWRRVDALRRQGRFLDRSSYTFIGPQPQDAWASIVSQIEHAGPKFVDGREMAANVAGKMRKYWEGENKAEEARMRNLARSTLKMVIEQWKKAVYVSGSWAL